MAPRWYDDGVRVQLAVSESGDFVSLGTRTEYPFQSGGSGGAPVGWTIAVDNAAIGDVNWTTQSGRFSVSNASTTDSHGGARYYMIWRDFPVTYGKNYLFQAQARTMDGKQSVVWDMDYLMNGTGQNYGVNGRSTSEWADLSVYISPSSLQTFVRVRLMINYYRFSGEVEVFDWGGQWQSFAIVELPGSVTPPVWHDVSCDVKELQIAYGRAKYTGRFEVGSAQITVQNRDGEFTYQDVHPWGLRPGRFVKVTVTTPQAHGFPGFYGLIDSIQNSYPIDGKNVTVLSCIDTSSLLSNSTVPSITPLNQTVWSGYRIQYLIRSAGWNMAFVFGEQGVFQQQGITSNGRSVRDEMGLSADSEGAFLFWDRQGYMIYHDRNWVKNGTTTSKVQAELMATCPVYMDEVKWKFPGVKGNSFALAYEANYGATSTVDVMARVSIDNVGSTNRQTLASQDNRWDFRVLNGQGFMEFSNGVSFATSTVPFPFGSGVICWVRCKYTRSNGQVQFYAMADTPTGNPPGSWVQLGSTVTITGTLPTQTTPIRIGDILSGFVQAFGGRLYRFQLADGAYYRIDIRPSQFPGTVGTTYMSVPADASIGANKVINVNQTAPNVIVQADPTVTPYRLVIVDDVPNAPVPVIQHLKSLETDWSRDRVVNDVQIANQGGSAFRKVDDASQKKYGPRTYQRLDFVNVDSITTQTATRIDDFINGWTEAMLRLNAVSLSPTIETYDWVLGMFLMDLVRVRYQHPTEGWGYAIATHIQGFVHSLTMNGWTTTLNLDQPESFVFWDTPVDTSTGWDGDYWDEGIWDDADGNVAYWTSGQVWSDSQTKWGP